MGKLWESRDGKYCFSWFFWWFGAAAPRVLVLSPTPPQRSLYTPDFRCADQFTRTNKYIYIYIDIDISFFMRLYLVEIYMRTERIKTFKNTPCSTCRRTCPTYLVRSISCISILMLHISISSVTGLISKKTPGTPKWTPAIGVRPSIWDRRVGAHRTRWTWSGSVERGCIPGRQALDVDGLLCVLATEVSATQWACCGRCCVVEEEF